MTCASVRDRLLEADPRDIVAALDGPVGSSPGGGLDHIAECVACREVAASVLADHRELSTALGSLTPGRPLADAVAAARREAARRSIRRTRRTWGLAAASLAALLGIRALQWRPSADLGPDEPVPDAMVSHLAPEVEVLLDESVMVLETEDEDVVVFWFYQGRGE